MKLKKGEKQVRYKDNGSMMFLKWKDKSYVMILSTFHKEEEEAKVLRTKKKVNISKSVDDYNKNMGGVDKCHQMLTAYLTERK
jgi:hypothetical protein